jgi:hypothetical protein
MVIEVQTEDLVSAAEQLRRIGRRVISYGDQLSGRMRQTADELDSEVSASLRAAWSEVAGAIDNLAEGFERYGGALVQVADRYRELESDLTVHRSR